MDQVIFINIISSDILVIQYSNVSVQILLFIQFCNVGSLFICFIDYFSLIINTSGSDKSFL